MHNWGVVQTRSHARRPWLQRWLWLALVCSVSCYGHDQPENRQSTLVGRYEPSKLPDGGASFAMQPCTRAEIMDQGLDEQSPGTLDITFTEAIAPGVKGKWDTPQTGNVSGAAIWIEDLNGALVRTLDLWCYTPFCLRCLDPYYERFFGGCTLDTKSRASLHAYETWTRSWDCRSLHGNIVPDGDYLLVIDVQIDEEHLMDPVSIPFTKGRKPWTMQPPPMPPQTGLKITYTPG
jgi:hypothetical protein